MMNSIRSDILDLGILILDDEEIVVKVLRRSLKRYGFSRVVTAMNAPQGIKILETVESPFAVILSDQNMPGMGGNEFFEKCQTLSPDSRRILMTGFLDFPATMTAINKGRIHKYIAKPWYPQDFVKMLLTELSAYQKGQEKKKLHSITRRQNSRLYTFAKTASQKDDEIKKQIALKKETRHFLKRTLEELKSASEPKKTVKGLDDFLSRTIKINQNSLDFAFKIIKTEIKSVLNTIAEQNNLTAPFNEENAGNKIKTAVAGGLDQERIYHLIDFMIEQTARAVEPLLFGYGTVMKNEFVDLKSKDKPAVTYLLENNLAAIKDIKRAYITQENRFRVGAGSDSIPDILYEHQVINHYLKQKLSADGNGTPPSEDQHRLPVPAILDDADLELIVSEDRTKAWIKRRDPLCEDIDITRLNMLLNDRGIVFGRVEDDSLEELFEKSPGHEDPFLVASGIDAVPGKDSTITYFFDTQYQRPGLENDDGTIDFRYTGEFTFVNAGDVLAEKEPAEKGRAGRDIFGKPIPVPEAVDIIFKQGFGTRVSQDGLRLISTTEGQPHLDPKGTVSVCKELTVEGDVDAETGHVDFQGNVFVSGSIEAGFKVSCVNLTAREIRGGHVDISGDLNVSRGIIDAEIKTTGNIKAKFVSNSKILAFGSMVINREIMGSEILLGGECVNQTGRITSSMISAAKGFDLCQVGTETSADIRLKVGVGDYLDARLDAYDREADAVKDEIDREMTQRNAVEKRVLELQKEIVDQSSANEKLQHKQMDLDRECKPGNPEEESWKDNTRNESETIATEISDTDASIKTLFDTQNVLMEQIEGHEIRTRELTANLETIKIQKKEIRQVCEQVKGHPVVKINKKLVAGIKIVGPNASMCVAHDLGACRISEINADDPVVSNVRKMMVQLI